MKKINNKSRIILPVLAFLSLGMLAGVGLTHNVNNEVKEADALDYPSRVYFTSDAFWHLTGKDKDLATDSWVYYRRDSITTSGEVETAGTIMVRYKYSDNEEIYSSSLFPGHNTKGGRVSGYVMKRGRVLVWRENDGKKYDGTYDSSRKFDQKQPVSFAIHPHNRGGTGDSYAWTTETTYNSTYNAVSICHFDGSNAPDVVSSKVDNGTAGRLYLNLSSLSNPAVTEVDFYNSNSPSQSIVESSYRSTSNQTETVDVLDGFGGKVTTVTVPWNATTVRVKYSLNGSGTYVTDNISLQTGSNKVKNQLNITGPGNQYSWSIPDNKIGNSIFLKYTGTGISSLNKNNVRAKFYYNYYKTEEVPAEITPTIVKDSQNNEYLKFDINTDSDGVEYQVRAQFYNTEGTYDTGVFALTANENIYYSSSELDEEPVAILFGPELDHLSAPSYNSARLFLKTGGSGVWSSTISSSGSITYNSINFLVGVRTWAEEDYLDNDAIIYPFTGFTDNDASTNKYAYVDLPINSVNYLQYVIYKEVGDTAAIYYSSPTRITVTWELYSKCQLTTGSSDDTCNVSSIVVIAGANLMEKVLSATDTCSNSIFNGYGGTNTQRRATALNANYYATSGELSSSVTTLNSALSYPIDNVMHCILGREGGNNPKFGMTTDIEKMFYRTNNSNLLIVIIVLATSIFVLMGASIVVLRRKKNSKNGGSYEE